jgi:DNA-binding CsgD family transcriptional regulator/tetratricopeptide (TPR) repeat protein
MAAVDYDAVTAQRRAAFRDCREAGLDVEAAKLAIFIGHDTLLFRGDATIAGGWFARAHTLLGDDPTIPETGWLWLREGQVAMHGGPGDVDTAIALADRAYQVGRATGVVDLEMSGLSLRGLCLVERGDVAAGMRCLDEATAAVVAEEVMGPSVAGNICCDLIFACKRVRDFDRAVRWCDEVQTICERYDLTGLFGVCRAHYADVLAWRGDWAGAERELDRAARDFADGAPALAFQERLVRASLRLRQGRVDDAALLCEPVRWHPTAMAMLALIARRRGDSQSAGDLVARGERVLGDGDRLTRIPVLEVELLLALDERRGDDAARVLAELERLAGEARSDPLRAALSLARARVAAADGFDDLCRRELEDAVDVFARCGAPYDEASARVELGHALARLGRPAAARGEWEHAAIAFGALGATLAEAEARALVARAAPGVLSPREVEVLRLVADGLSDEEIAGRLVLSPHTVHRHVANVRTKLGQPTRAAAAALATRDGLI